MKQEELNKILNEHKLWMNSNGGKRAYLQGADLHGAYLQCADLQRADLQGADLQGAYLQGADLQGAYLQGAYGLNINCPETGSFIGYKKAYLYEKSTSVIVKLQITEDAKRFSATGRKCRCDKAIVLEISDILGVDTTIKKARSKHDSGFLYNVGETIAVDNFDTDRWNECSTGIHFFITRQEAVEY